MTRAALLLAVLVLAACGTHSSRSPEDVARAWSAALNRNDNEAAAKLFAADAQVVQGDALELQSRDDAIQWNAALPCGGTVTRVVARAKGEVLLVFRLKERPGHVCDAPGQEAAAIFRIVDGKIVLWHQTGVPTGEGEPVV